MYYLRAFAVGTVIWLLFGAALTAILSLGISRLSNSLFVAALNTLVIGGVWALGASEYPLPSPLNVRAYSLVGRSHRTGETTPNIVRLASAVCATLLLLAAAVVAGLAS